MVISSQRILATGIVIGHCDIGHIHELHVQAGQSSLSSCGDSHSQLGRVAVKELEDIAHLENDSTTVRTRLTNKEGILMNGLIRK